MSETDYERMRQIAVGRVQVAAELRLRATEQLVDALRCAYRAGESLEVLRIESGLPNRLILKIVRGKGVCEALEEVSA